MIGTIQGINKAGTVRQGPIPGLGGPFATATDFFQAWCTKTKFGLSDDRLRQACGAYADELNSAERLKASSPFADEAYDESVRHEDDNV